MADVIACLALSAITKRIGAEIEALGLVAQLDQAPGSETFGGSGLMLRGALLARNVGIVDDECFPLIAPASEIVSGVARCVGVIFREYQLQGMEVHLKPGKTAVVIRAMGVGAKVLQERLPSLKAQGIPFDDVRSLRVCVTNEYKHLGCMLQEDGGFSSEVCQRSAIICAAARPLCRKLLSNVLVPVDTRLRLANALACSKGDYGAAVWPELSAREASRHHGAHLRVLRSVAGKERWKGAVAGSDSSVLISLGAIQPRMQRMIARLSLFVRAVSGGHCQLLWVLALGLRAKRSWLRTVIDDLAWLALRDGPLARFRSGGLVAWCRAMAESPKHIIGALKTSIREASDEILANPFPWAR